MGHTSKCEKKGKEAREKADKKKITSQRGEEKKKEQKQEAEEGDIANIMADQIKSFEGMTRTVAGKEDGSGGHRSIKKD